MSCISARSLRAPPHIFPSRSPVSHYADGPPCRVARLFHMKIYYCIFAVDRTNHLTRNESQFLRRNREHGWLLDLFLRL